MGIILGFRQSTIALASKTFWTIRRDTSLKKLDSQCSEK